MDFPRLLPSITIPFLVLLAIFIMFLTQRRRKRLLARMVEFLDERTGEAVEQLLYQSGQLEGHFRGRAVALSVTADGKNRPPEFRIKLSCLAPLTFEIGKESSGDRVLKALHLEQDVEVGDPELDRQFVFSRTDPARLTCPQVRAREWCRNRRERARES